MRAPLHDDGALGEGIQHEQGSGEARRERKLHKRVLIEARRLAHGRGGLHAGATRLRGLRVRGVVCMPRWHEAARFEHSRDGALALVAASDQPARLRCAEVSEAIVEGAVTKRVRGGACAVCCGAGLRPLHFPVVGRE